MMAVPDFSRALLRKVGAPAGTVSTYIEPQFKLLEAKVQPDGAIVVRRGANSWCALVEVKTSTNELRREQIEQYLDLARERSFDCVITVSNQMLTATDSHPLAVDKRKTRSVELVHWSWVEVLTEAVMQREHRGVSDPDQAWILGELIAYLKHPQSGAMQFQDMGPHWVTVRDAARENALRAQDVGVNEVAIKWDQFIQYLCFALCRRPRSGSHSGLVSSREFKPSRQEERPGPRACTSEISHWGSQNQECHSSNKLVRVAQRPRNDCFSRYRRANRRARNDASQLACTSVEGRARLNEDYRCIRRRKRNELGSIGRPARRSVPHLAGG
jgi:hypothetical protein